MSETPPEHIGKMDWRINNITWTTAPFSIPKNAAVVPAGSAVMQAAIVRYGKERVGITVPNATALFLDLSRSHRVEAERLATKCIAEKGKTGHLPEGDAFSFYEHIMASVVFAYSSLEAFVNEELPDNYNFEVTDKNCSRRYSKDQIERYLNLDTKLGDVLPQVLNVTSPKGGKLWNEYDVLGKLRDRIIHMKTKDRNACGEEPESIWNALLTNPLPETYTTAKNLIEHFVNAKGKPPRWFEKCPF